MRRTAALALAAAGTGAVVGGAPAWAARWTISPSAGASETYTTNVNLATGDTKKKSDLITSLSPAVSVVGAGGRVNLNLNYVANLSLYKRESNRDDLSNNLTATGTAELWQRQLFFDANAAIFRHAINPALATSATPGVNAVNAADTASWQAGPRFLHHFGSYVDTVSTITHSEVSGKATSAANANGALSSAALGAANTSTRINATTFRATSGRAFTRVLWSATANDTRTGRGDELSGIKSKTINSNVTYVINRQYALLGGLGWQDVKDATLNQPPHGITWNVGVRLNPGPRTSFTVNYNHRDNSNFFSFSGAYRLSTRTTITTSYDEALTFTQQQIATSLAFAVPDPLNPGQFIDSRTGLPFSPGALDFAAQSQTSRTTTFRMGLNGSRGRNTFSAVFSHADRTTDQPTGQTGTAQTTNNVSLTWTRQINHRLSGALTANFQTTDQQPNNENDRRLVGSVSLNYLLTPTATATLVANTSRLDSNVESRVTNETSISLALRKRF